MLQRFLSHVTRLRALSPAERRMLFAAAALLPLFWLGLRILGLARFRSLLTRAPLPPRASVAPGLAECVNIAARHSPLPVTCLTRSLLLEWMLRRRGIASDLRIGVRFVEGTLDAHAWLECEGAPINDRPGVAGEFAPFDRPLPAAAFDHP